MVPHGRGHRGAERVVAGEPRVHALRRVVVGRRRGSRGGSGRARGVATTAAFVRRRVVEDRAAGDGVTVVSGRHLSVISIVNRTVTQSTLDGQMLILNDLDQR